MNDTPNMESILRRVQKLLAIANDSRADPNEAAAAAGQAEKIMRKYQIDNADAMRSEMQHPEAFDTADVQVLMKREANNGYRPQKIPGWGGWLAYRVAKLFDCEIRYVTTVKGASVRFYGFKADVQVAAWTFDYLVLSTIAGVRQYQAESKRAGFARTKAESESFRRGFALAVCNMLSAETEKKKAAMQEAVASRALVVVKANAITEKYGSFTYSTGSSKANLVGDAYAAGRAAGSKVQLRQGVTNSSNTGGALALK